LSEKTESKTPSNGTADTVIGEGMRLDGSIEFGGELLIRGVISGNVAGASGHSGKLVIDASGSVTGDVSAPHIVLKGRIDGPMHSSQLIEIQAGGCSNGDVFYHRLDVHTGGKVSGMLTSMKYPENDPTAPPPQPGALPAESARASASTGTSARQGAKQQKRFALWALAASLIVISVIGLSQRNRTPPADRVTILENTPPVTPSTISPPSEPAAPPTIEPAPAAAPTPVAVPVVPNPPEAAPQNSAERPEPDPRRVLAIPGANPAKSAGVLYLIVKEPAVFYKKKRDDSTNGTRVDVPKSKTFSVPIGRNEVFRVARGSAVEIFYQGRKVSQRSIDLGEWMSFTPVTVEE